MAAYSGTTTLLWNVNLGNKIVSLVKVEITNYNQTGIPLTGKQVGMDQIEWIGLNCLLGDSQSPVAVSYDSTNKVCHLYKESTVEVDTDINLHSSIGDLKLLVFGM